MYKLQSIAKNPPQENPFVRVHSPVLFTQTGPSTEPLWTNLGVTEYSLFRNGE